MTRKPSTLKSVQESHVPSLSRTLMYTRPVPKQGPRVCTQRPSPTLSVRFPHDRVLRQAVFGPNRQHPAMMHFGLALELVRLYNPTGGTVFDPFGGVGTTAVAALADGSNAILTEIEPEWSRVATEVVHRFLEEQPLEVSEYRAVVPIHELRWRPTGHNNFLRQSPSVIVHNMHARDLKDVPSRVSAVITSPPYMNVFGGNEKPRHLLGQVIAASYTTKGPSMNLAREANPHYFGLGLGEIYANARNLLEVGGAFVVVCKDPVRKNLRQPFAFQNIHLLEALGLVLRDWWRRECVPSLFANVQRKRNLDAPRIDHEDVLVFEKVIA
jgi:hypothetical protein